MGILLLKIIENCFSFNFEYYLEFATNLVIYISNQVADEIVKFCIWDCKNLIYIN